MGLAAVTGVPVQYEDVQGIVRFGYKRLTEACYVLLRIADPDAARAWLRAAPVADASDKQPLPATALQVAFTATGLRELGVPEVALAQFAPEFLSGMAGDENRSRRLGDVAANAPERWSWGTGAREPHVLAALYAEPGKLDAFAASVKAAHWGVAFNELASLDTSDLHGFEHFGFSDGISQPEIDWDRRRVLRGNKVRYGNDVALGEFLLGYPNEYDRYTERPVLGAGGAADLLSAAEDAPGKRDAGRNGTYLVLRDLRQDVRAFWQYAKTEDVAGTFVGRRRNGDPLVGAGSSQNDFTYESDPNGTRCPFGAHVRRANPRNADFPSPPRNAIATGAAMLGLIGREFHDDLTSSVRFHRILRRGREYGPALDPCDARWAARPREPERGLRFLCLNANLSRQFEFLQNAWLASDTFGGLIGEADALLGSRAPDPAGRATDTFVINRAGGARTRLRDMPQFVRVTGGAYFFLPGLRTLRYFTHAAEDTP